MINVVKSIVASLIATLLGCTTEKQLDSIVKGGDLSNAAVDKMIVLEQGWDDETKARFRTTGQGSLIIPYDWFLFLEQANNTELFRSNENIERLHYIPQEPDAWNPDGVPIGFAKSFDPKTKRQWMGLNCAACHTSKISYRNKNILIDGAPAMGDFQAFIQQLEAAQKDTLENKGKFERFAKNVLGNNYSEGSAKELKSKLTKVTHERSNNNKINTSKTDYGYGRLDGFGITWNNLAVEFLGIPENQIDPNAPASYPFLWGSLHSDYMQWSGSAPNTPIIGTTLRVAGEIWGTFGHAAITPGENPPGYASSVPFEDVDKLLGWIEELRSPQWPEDILPKIDTKMAASGKIHYQKNCQQCHQLMTREQQKEPYKAVLVPYKEVGTDPTEVELITTNMSKTGPLEGVPKAVLFGDKFGPEEYTVSILFHVSLGAMMRHPDPATREALNTNMRDYVNARVNAQVYKARPLTGIWTAAPYLHNGSVPNLYQMLLPPEQRKKVFYVGNPEFDPRHVGFVNSSPKDAFKFDTRLTGNRNTGHEYGTNLSDPEKWELIEYMKTL